MLIDRFYFHLKRVKTDKDILQTSRMVQNPSKFRIWKKKMGRALQNFPKFLSGRELRRFKLKQIELIREIQKIPTTLVSESFWMKILPLKIL
jgi:hypothetical protein